MKKLTLILCLLFAPMPALFTACGTAPAARQVQVHTLLAVGQTAKTAMDAAAQALKAWAKTNNFKGKMAGAIIEMRNETVVR